MPSKIPNQCKDCLRLRGDGICHVLTTLMTKPCFARITDKEKASNIEKSIAEYNSQKSLQTGHRGSSETVDEVPPELYTGPPHAGWMATYVESIHRGTNRGGSSDKEKAGHKKKKGNKKLEYEWSGFEQ